MGTSLTALRWLLVPVSAAFGCWFGIMLAYLLYTRAYLPTYDQPFALYAGAAAGAAITALLPFFLAPSHKRTASTFAFFLGVAFTMYEAHRGGVWAYAACAIATGIASLAWAWRKRTASLSAL